MNCAPATIFFARRNGRYSYGGANGFSTAPMKKSGAIFGISLPFSNTWLFRIMRAMRIRLSESMS